MKSVLCFSLNFTAQKGEFPLAGTRFAESYLPAFGNMLLGSAPRRSNAFCCPGVGAVTSLKLSESPIETSFSATVERSASRVWKLCTAVSSGARFCAALARAEGEGLAGSTGEARCARAASGSSSSNRIGASRFLMCHYAQEGAGAGFAVDEDRPDSRTPGLDLPEGLLDLRQAFASLHRLVRSDAAGVEAGADDPKSVERGFAVDPVLAAAP